MNCTLIVPYYRNVAMLREQATEWLRYPADMRIILVDDGSPEPALDVIRGVGHTGALSVFRILKDVPWNRGGARNLGSHLADTKWIAHVDIDHLLPADCATRLLETQLDNRFWYRFPRFRRGQADETRRKDKIPDDVEFGEIHPHIDSYVCRRELYWKSGGYDEDYSGCLGGGSPFLKRFESMAPVKLLSKNVFLCVYTRSVVADASDHTLSRDTTEYARRKKVKEASNNTIPKNPMRFEWERVL